jgi:hypothetical protein
VVLPKARGERPSAQAGSSRARARSGEHYAYELEEHLDDFLMDVFHVEAEDGSPAEARGGCAAAATAACRARAARARADAGAPACPCHAAAGGGAAGARV